MGERVLGKKISILQTYQVWVPAGNQSSLHS